MKALEKYIGKRIAIYGPNYIWRGELKEVNGKFLVLSDVYQVLDTGDHDTEVCESERISDEQVFPVSAICNVGPAKWA